MKQLVIICGENETRCRQIVDIVLKETNDAEFVERITTNKAENIGCRVVTNSDFWDMVEQGKFFEVIGSNDGYYGVPHINKDNIKDQYMVYNVGVALAIKKRYPKAITIYILPEGTEKIFMCNSNTFEAKKLDFCVVDKDEISTAKKIEEIVQFI